MRLGLIAMSGVRIFDPELMALGLTLPGFVERSRVIASLPSLALLTLAGLTPQEVETHYLEVPDLSTVPDLPGEFDAVAISSYTAQIKDAYRLADRYRAAGTRVILGGLHVTARPEEASGHADALVLGEAEALWPKVIHDFSRGTLQPIYDARGRAFDLALAPMPRFELLDASRYNRITLQTQRGCPFSCEFCASSIRLAPRFRTKPVEKVSAEIRRIKEIMPDPFIELADDNTFANPAYAKRLVREIAGHDVRWFTETDISVADDAELLDLLADSGCAQLLIGLEAPSRRGLEGVETRANWKAEQADRYLAAIDRIQRRGITVNGCFILGLDGEGEDSFDRVLEFVKESALYEVQVTMLTPFPGTPLHDRLSGDGRLLYEDAWERCTLFDITFRPDAMEPAVFEQRFRNLIAALYTDEMKAWRRGEFRRRLRQKS